MALAAERPGAHPLTRYLFNSGFGEGWALYAEQVANELGLYSSDLDHMGRLSSDALRAARLVVDAGIHALGWSRQQAIDYMVAHTAESKAFIESEVDRYIILPGQATAYMVGRLEIERLRKEAEQRMGDRFDIRTLPRPGARGRERAAVAAPAKDRALGRRRTEAKHLLTRPCTARRTVRRLHMASKIGDRSQWCSGWPHGCPCFSRRRTQGGMAVHDARRVHADDIGRPRLDPRGGHLEPVQLLIGLGLGYTWRRAPP